MSPRLKGRGFLWLLSCSIALAAPACQTQEEPAASAPRTTAPPAAGGPAAASAPATDRATSERPRNEIPPGELEAVIAAHFKGAGLMEQYEYGKAAEAFREVSKRAPGWIPGSINLSIALLNMTGEQVESSKKSGGGASLGNFDEALQILTNVLECDPDNRHAHFCKGMILEQKGDLAEAHKHFLRVTELDPHDATAWYWAASDTVEPLPWRGMPAFPFAPGVVRPANSTFEAYLREYQTRPAGGTGALR